MALCNTKTYQTAACLPWNSKAASHSLPPSPFPPLYIFSSSCCPPTPVFFFLLKWHEGWDGLSPRSSRLRPHRWGEIKVLCEPLTVLPFYTQVEGTRGEEEEAGGGRREEGATCGRDITALSHIMYHLQLHVKPKETDFICHLWEDLNIIYSADLTSRGEA